jgi:RNA polymerase sigma factor (sigma-70 family)
MVLARSGVKAGGSVQEQRALADQAIEGDAATAELLIASLVPPLRRALGRLSASNADAEDALQETLLAVRAALPSFRGDCTLLQFALSIARRRALSLRRCEHRERNRIERYGQLQAPLALAPTLPIEHLTRHAERQALASAMRKLPSGQVEAFVRRIVWEDSLQEIASACDVPVNTVRTRLRLARVNLRRLL